MSDKEDDADSENNDSDNSLQYEDYVTNEEEKKRAERHKVFALGMNCRSSYSFMDGRALTC